MTNKLNINIDQGLFILFHLRPS